MTDRACRRHQRSGHAPASFLRPSHPNGATISTASNGARPSKPMQRPSWPAGRSSRHRGCPGRPKAALASDSRNRQDPSRAASPARRRDKPMTAVRPWKDRDKARHRQNDAGLRDRHRAPRREYPFSPCHLLLPRFIPKNIARLLANSSNGHCEDCGARLLFLPR